MLLETISDKLRDNWKILVITFVVLMAIIVLRSGKLGLVEPSNLHEAARKGDTQVIQKLVAKGADVNGRDMLNMTPLHWAAWWGRTEAVRVLLAHGANPNSWVKESGTPLHFAATHGREETAQLLIEAGANINATDEYGTTPLTSAIISGSVEIVELLLSNGANVYTRDKKGKTPLDHAKEMVETRFRPTPASKEAHRMCLKLLQDHISKKDKQ